MTDLKERAIRAATERGTSNAEQLAAMEAVRRATVEDWLKRRLHHLMRRVLDTDINLADITVREAAMPGIDWTKGSITADANGLTFGTGGVFGHDGRNIPVGDDSLLVWIPCETCGHESGPFHVGSLSGLGSLLAAWGRCETCQTAAATGPAHTSGAPSVCLPSTPRMTLDRERMARRRAQGGGLEVVK